MQVKVIVERCGFPGAVFRLVLGEKLIPYGLSVFAARQLNSALTRALERHDRLRSAERR